MKTRTNHNSDVFRHEVKYYINERQAYILARYFQSIMHIDRHADADGQYFIRSLYFDTLHNRDYYDKVNGYAQRKKIRLRIYDTSSETVKLELKSKRNAYVNKESIPISREDTIRLIHGNYTFLSAIPSGAQDNFHACFLHERLRPILLIDYERQAFDLPFENIRITIDRNLRVSMNALHLFNKDISCTNVMNKACRILEVKYRYAIPCFVRSVLSGIDIQSTSISKYALCRQTIEF